MYKIDIQPFLDRIYAKVNHKHDDDYAQKAHTHNNYLTQLPQHEHDNSVDIYDSNAEEYTNLSNNFNDTTRQSSINEAVNNKIGYLNTNKLSITGGHLSGALSSDSYITTNGIIKGSSFKIDNENGFLKADGSVDDSTYLTSVATNNIQNKAVTNDKIDDGTIQSGKIQALDANKVILGPNYEGDDVETVITYLDENKAPNSHVSAQATLDTTGHVKLGTTNNTAAVGDHTHNETYALIGHEHDWKTVKEFTGDIGYLHGSLKVNEKIHLACFDTYANYNSWGADTRYGPYSFDLRPYVPKSKTTPLSTTWQTAIAGAVLTNATNEITNELISTDFYVHFLTEFPRTLNTNRTVRYYAFYIY